MAEVTNKNSYANVNVEPIKITREMLQRTYDEIMEAPMRPPSVMMWGGHALYLVRRFGARAVQRGMAGITILCDVRTHEFLQWVLRTPPDYVDYTMDRGIN